MTNQHDIAEECEHRLDGFGTNGSYFDTEIVAEIKADLARYAAHMRQQGEEIDILLRQVRRKSEEIVDLKGKLAVLKKLRVDEWQRLARYVGNGSDWAFAVSKDIAAIVEILKTEGSQNNG